MAGEIVVAPVSMTQGVRGKAEYTIVLCGECDQQAERALWGNNDYQCPEHGRCKTVRYAAVRWCRLTLGSPIEPVGTS